MRSVTSGSEQWPTTTVRPVGLAGDEVGHAVVDPDERARYEEHLASCERCRDELQGFWQVAGALGRAAGGPTPPASLRERILQQARDERPNVVPLRRRITAPVLASAAAVAAVVAVALGIWSLGLSRDLDDATTTRTG